MNVALLAVASLYLLAKVVACALPERTWQTARVRSLVVVGNSLAVTVAVLAIVRVA